MNKLSALILVLLSTIATGALAAKPLDTKVASLDEARCKKEVNQYVDALQFVTQSAGKDLGDKVMHKYVSLDQLNQLVASNGYCSAAQVLKERQAFR